MRIACVYIPHFHVQIESLRTPELKKHPVVVGGAPDERATVVDCSDAAAEKGVSIGMPLRDAYHLCPEAVFLTFDKDLSGEVWEEVLYLLGAITLRMEPKEQGLVYLDITKALKLYASEEYISSTIIDAMRDAFQLKVRAGVGNSRFIAEQAALCAPKQILVVRPGTEKDFVASLQVDRLPVDEEIKERLRLLGLRRLEKVAGLSRQAVISQFGKEGKRISDIVNGAEDKRQIAKRDRAISLEREVTGDLPFETMDQVAGALGSALAELSSELKKMGKVCRKLKVTLNLHTRYVERTFVLKNPTAEAKEMLARIVNRLEGITMEGPVTGFTLAVSDLSADAGIQEYLFRKRAVLSEKLKGVKGYLEAMYGYTPLFMVREGEGNSLLPERKFVFSEI
jgi:nucleotidyltransferase/DNA polymerase involved in DNA repair